MFSPKPNVSWYLCISFTTPSAWTLFSFSPHPASLMPSSIINLFLSCCFCNLSYGTMSFYIGKIGLLSWSTLSKRFATHKPPKWCFPSIYHMYKSPYSLVLVSGPQMTSSHNSIQLSHIFKENLNHLITCKSTFESMNIWIQPCKSFIFILMKPFQSQQKPPKAFFRVSRTFPCPFFPFPRSWAPFTIHKPMIRTKIALFAPNFSFGDHNTNGHYRCPYCYSFFI